MNSYVVFEVWPAHQDLQAMQALELNCAYHTMIGMVKLHSCWAARSQASQMVPSTETLSSHGVKNGERSWNMVSFLPYPLTESLAQGLNQRRNIYLQRLICK